MKKNKAIVILLCILLLLVGVTYVDIFGVNAAGDGSASTIKLGLDLAGGVSITYQVVGDETPSATDMADTREKLQKRVEPSCRSWDGPGHCTLLPRRIPREMPTMTDTPM